MPNKTGEKTAFFHLFSTFLRDKKKKTWNRKCKSVAVTLRNVKWPVSKNIKTTSNRQNEMMTIDVEINKCAKTRSEATQTPQLEQHRPK
jgi:hypothetical protein